ncbi:MAG TPA: TonB-dependent receptor [Thermoanaerobaculia bacterium]|jgi:iron complex outermembrane receptor protein
MFRSFARVSRAVSLFLFLCSAAIASAQNATIIGTVYDPQAQPVGDATVTIVELRRATKTAADGTFRFDGVPPRHYHLRAESPRLGSTVGEAEVRAGETRTVEVVIDPLVHAEEIVVTASADSRRESEVYQPVNVLSAEELSARQQPTLGETLAQEPGISSTSFGAGASRPVIRGLGADRVRVLENGVGTGDVSNISPDHAVSVETAGAEQIEIVRGPATLLYGSNAVGGVVNVITERIPTRVPSQLVTGTLDLRYASAAEEKTNMLSLQGGRGSLAWHADVTLRDTNDYAIPSPADPDDDPEHFTGTLENSALQARSGTFGASWIAARGYLGFSVTNFSTLYGVPGHQHHGEEEEEGEEGAGVRIDLDQRRVDLQGELSQLGIFNSVRVRFGTTDYQHVELEGAEIGTRFTSDGWEGRLEAHHRTFGAINGTWGVQTSLTDFVAAGEEAYIPPNESRSAAVFAFEEWRGTKLDVQFGGRYERHEVSVTEGDLPSRDFNGVSGSIGAIYRPVEGYVVAFSLARAVRLPTATELYANGPHAATSQFEVGNPNLNEETSVGVDLSFRRTVGPFRGELNLFNNAFDGFIFDAPTGDVEDDFPVFQFVQRDARFRGMELLTHTHVASRGESHLELDLGADYVRATLADGGGNLPRIPPMRAMVGLRLHGGPLTAMAEVRHTFEQDETAPNETSTDGYTFVNAHVGYRFFLASTIHDVMLRATNLTNELARSHPSPLKDVAPLPGRDITLSYRVGF